MPGSTVRISSETSTTLREIAARQGKSLQFVLDEAVEEYRRHCFLQEANQAYLTLRDKSREWKEELGERKQWEATLSDGQKD
jgi:predicted transcriptional regulator